MAFGIIIIAGNVLMGGLERDIPLLSQPSGPYDLIISLLSPVFVILLVLVSLKK